MIRTPLLAVVAAAALLTPVLAPAGPATAASFTACSGGFNPDGSTGSFYSGIKAKRVGCATARTVTRTWVRRHADGSTNPTKASKVLGYTCRGRSVSSAGDPNGGLSVLCVNGRKAVTFYGHP